MQVFFNEISKIIVAFLNEGFKIIVQFVFVVVRSSSLFIKEITLNDIDYII